MVERPSNYVILSVLLISAIFSFPTTTTAQTNCSSFAFSNGRPFATCIILPVLNSFLHWTYHAENGTVDLAYRHPGVTSSNWVAWALNPSSSGMANAQCLVAFQNSSGVIRAYTSPIPASKATTLAEGPLSFQVPNITAEFVGGSAIIYATIQLPAGGTSFQQVWQMGPVSGGSPQSHDTSSGSANTRSVGTVDFATGIATAEGGSNSRVRRRNVHGVLNAVSWGILMPLGAVIARYLKVFKSTTPAWFYLHVACQISAYVVGVAGWGTGLKLGSDSKGITYDTHRNIGITLFALGTLQLFALLLRPKPDHKYRLYWNLYHWSVGYVVIILSIVNIFKGFDILDPEKKWKNAYIGIIIAIGVVAAALEAFTWFVVLRRKKNGEAKYPAGPQASNGVNGTNGYNGRTHDRELGA